MRDRAITKKLQKNCKFLLTAPLKPCYNVAIASKRDTKEPLRDIDRATERAEDIKRSVRTIKPNLDNVTSKHTPYKLLLYKRELLVDIEIKRRRYKVLFSVTAIKH